MNAARIVDEAQNRDDTLGEITLTLRNVETPEGGHEDMTFTIARLDTIARYRIARLEGPDGDFTAQTANTTSLLLLLAQALLKYGPRVPILGRTGGY